MIFGPGEWFADRWTPAGVTVESWANFINFSLLLIIAVGVGVYAYYRFSLNYKRRVKSPDDVFRLRTPWLWGIALAGVAQLILTLIGGVLIASTRSAEVIMAILSVGFVEGVCAALLYIVVSNLLGVPARVKYIPFWSYRSR